MRGCVIESISGVKIEEDKIDSIARKAIKTIVSELPEEAQTLDVIQYVLKAAKEQANGCRIRL
jgi:hypothetical protein